MKAFLVSNFQRAQALVALSLTMAAMILLLSLWSWLPPVEARGPAAIGVSNAGFILSSSDTITTFLPIVFKSDVVFSDDFSNTSSGWPHKVTLSQNCYVEYHEGHYRVKVTKKDQRCIISNSKIPKLVNGTFSVRVRRTSDKNRRLLYGLIFGAGKDATKNRWALEVYPNNDESCGNRKPFYQLTAIVDGQRKYFQKRCTDAIDTDKDDWNELRVIRNGQNIKVYVNGRLKGDYNEAKYLLNEGYSLLEVVSSSDQTIYVEFDDLTIRRSTTP